MFKGNHPVEQNINPIQVSPNIRTTFWQRLQKRFRDNPDYSTSAQTKISLQNPKTDTTTDPRGFLIRKNSDGVKTYLGLDPKQETKQQALATLASNTEVSLATIRDTIRKSTAIAEIITPDQITYLNNLLRELRTMIAAAGNTTTVKAKAAEISAFLIDLKMKLNRIPDQAAKKSTDDCIC